MSSRKTVDALVDADSDGVSVQLDLPGSAWEAMRDELEGRDGWEVLGTRGLQLVTGGCELILYNEDVEVSL